MPSIIFLINENNLDPTQFEGKPMGGTISGTVLLAEALALLNHKVAIYFNAPEWQEITIRGVSYAAFSNQPLKADLAISNNIAKPLALVDAPVKVVWQHNQQTLSRIFKKKELLPTLKMRPHLVSLSPDALNNTSWLLPFCHRHIIPHAIEDGFLKEATTSVTQLQPKAFFASRASRNLDWVIECWKKYIHPKLPEAEFYFCTPPGSTPSFDPEPLKEQNIFYLGSLSKLALAELMLSSRALLYPGHKSETGCQVALQAIGLGVPIVTSGIGSLKNLVIHTKTGFIETDIQQYAQRAIECLTNDSLWETLHHNTMQHDNRKSYQDRAKEWQNIFL